MRDIDQHPIIYIILEKIPITVRINRHHTLTISIVHIPSLYNLHKARSQNAPQSARRQQTNISNARTLNYCRVIYAAAECNHIFRHLMLSWCRYDLAHDDSRACAPYHNRTTNQAPSILFFGGADRH